MTPEAKVKKKVKQILDSFECYYFSPNMGGYGSSGVPDIIACHQGKFLAIECKAGKNTMTELQKYNMERIQKAKGLSIMVNESNMEELITLLKGII